MKSGSLAAIDLLFCVAAHVLLRVAGLLPFLFVLRLGRAGGDLFYRLDVRHRRVALRNLTQSFGNEKSPSELRSIARENFRRIGESFAGALKFASISSGELRRRLEFHSADSSFQTALSEAIPVSRIIALGHFGNFELLTQITRFFPAYRSATTYRGIPFPRLERLLISLRARCGCQLFERRTQARPFRTLMKNSGFIFGLAADQNASTGRVRLPFLGQDCWTSSAPALFALRFRHPLHVAVCYRVALGKWRIEISPEIPTRISGAARSVGEIMNDVNGIFEQAVRRDPANWFWVHKRWKASAAATAPLPEPSGLPELVATGE